MGMAGRPKHASAGRWGVTQLVTPALVLRLGFYAPLAFQNLTVSLFTCGFRKSVVNTKVKK